MSPESQARAREKAGQLMCTLTENMKPGKVYSMGTNLKGFTKLKYRIKFWWDYRFLWFFGKRIFHRGKYWSGFPKWTDTSTKYHISTNGYVKISFTEEDE